MGRTNEETDCAGNKEGDSIAVRHYNNGRISFYQVKVEKMHFVSLCVWRVAGAAPADADYNTACILIFTLGARTERAL